jgi:hypothetical protein
MHGMNNIKNFDKYENIYIYIYIYIYIGVCVCVRPYLPARIISLREQLNSSVCFNVQWLEFRERFWPSIKQTLQFMKLAFSFLNLPCL